MEAYLFNVTPETLVHPLSKIYMFVLKFYLTQSCTLHTIFLSYLSKVRAFFFKELH